MGKLESPRRAGPSRSRGFSLTELVVSAAIMMTLTAIAVPSLIHSYRLYQLNDSASRLAGMLKFTRFEAIRKNTLVRCRIQQTGSDWLVWADSNGNAVPDPTESQYEITGWVTLLPSGAPPDPTPIVAALGGGAYSVLSGSNGSIGFDQRGALIYGPGATPVTYVLYLGDSGNPEYGYRAVVVLSSGIVHVWTAPGGASWQQIS